MAKNNESVSIIEGRILPFLERHALLLTSLLIIVISAANVRMWEYLYQIPDAFAQYIGFPFVVTFLMVLLIIFFVFMKEKKEYLSRDNKMSCLQVASAVLVFQLVLTGQAKPYDFEANTLFNIPVGEIYSEDKLSQWNSQLNGQRILPTDESVFQEYRCNNQNCIYLTLDELRDESDKTISTESMMHQATLILYLNESGRIKSIYAIAAVEKARIHAAIKKKFTGHTNLTASFFVGSSSIKLSGSGDSATLWNGRHIVEINDDYFALHASDLYNSIMYSETSETSDAVKQGQAKISKMFSNN